MELEHNNNSQLRAETEKLRSENRRYREALSNASCYNCGRPTTTFDEHQLNIENARLREEVSQVSAVVAWYVGKPTANYLLAPPQPLSVEGHSTKEASRFNSDDKLVIVEMAIAAMEELVRMVQTNEPLWIPSVDGSKTDVLNDEEYMATHSTIFGTKRSKFKREASRESAIVSMSPIDLVPILMDVENQWSSTFSAIVSESVMLEVLSTGATRTYDGVMQVVSAGYHISSPLVPKRESYFVRYCKEQIEGTWVVVDVSLDALHPSSSIRCQRRPSGCLIKELPNGYSKITWVEHVEVEDEGVSYLYKSLVDSGLAFGAKRWLATLSHYCERLSCTQSKNIPISELKVTRSVEGRKRLFNLAQRMVTGFFGGMSASTGKIWTTISETEVEDLRMMVFRNIDDPGRPHGTILSVASSFWLSVPPPRVYDFLCDETTRNGWDILSAGADVEEIAHIANGHDPSSYISIFSVNSRPRVWHRDMLILQESYKDATGSFVIYAPVDFVAMDVMLWGGNPDRLNILPSGFAIFPDGPTRIYSDDHLVEAGGSLVTLAFQILAESDPGAEVSGEHMKIVNTLIGYTINKIRKGLLGEDGTA